MKIQTKEIKSSKKQR